MKTIKNNNKNLFCSDKQSYKIVAVFVVALIFSSILNVNKTFAYFSDTATVSGTTFMAGTLDISLDNINTFSSGLMYPADSTSTSVDIKNIGSLDSQYIVQTELSGSDVSACDFVTMTATSSTTSYTGLIKNFISATTTTTDINWNFNFTLNQNTPPSVWGKTCFFKWKYSAWQKNFPDSSSGFSSVKEKTGEIHIGKAVVMNEILPNPEGSDTQHGLQGEWVELYNNSNISIDLAGWKIKDLAGNTKIISSVNMFNGRTKIGAKGSGLEWVVVFMNGQILNNDGDTVYFTDQSDNIIDQYVYGNSKNDDDSDSNSTGGGSNDNPSGSETAGNEGKSYARIPDGIGAWVDPIPTPGGTNDFSEILETSSTTEELLATSTALTTTSVGSTDVVLENVATSSDNTELVESIATTTVNTISNNNADVASTTFSVNESKGVVDESISNEPETVVMPTASEQIATVSNSVTESTFTPESIPVIESSTVPEVSVSDSESEINQ